MGGRHSADRGASDSGAGDAYEALLERYGPGLFRYALGLTGGDRAEAKAIVKETWYRVTQEPARVARRAPSTRAWLTVLARGVFDEWHPRSPDEPFVPSSPTPGQTTTVVQAMESLSRAHREILVELFYRGTSLEDAAAARDVPVETVKSRLYYAMRSLRVVLDQQAP